MKIRPTKLGAALLEIAGMLVAVGIWVLLFFSLYSLEPAVQP